MTRGPSRHLPRRLRMSAGALVLSSLLAGGGALLAAAPVLSQVTIGEALAGGVVVTGRITDVFDDRVLIEDPTGRVLVETAGAADRPADLAVGQSVRIEGRMRGRVLEARRISSEEVVVAPTGETPPAAAAEPRAGLPPAGGTDLSAALMRPADRTAIRSAIEAAGFSVAGGAVRHDKHTEVPVRDGRGRNWVAWLDRFGRLEEVEIVDYDEDRVHSSPSFSAEDLGRLVGREGFQARAAATPKRHHFEVLATNARSELVELHVDYAGQIYKQVWIR